MSTEEIYRKYMGALTAVGIEHGDRMSADAIGLALRLAIQDACDAAPDTDLPALVASQDASLIALQDALISRQNEIDRLRAERHSQPDRRHYEHLQAQISRLDEWLAEKAHALYRTPGDTADAVLKTIDALQGAVAEYQQQLNQMDADNAGLVAELVEAKAALEHWRNEADLAAAHGVAVEAELIETRQFRDHLHDQLIFLDAQRLAPAPAPATIHANGDAPTRPAPTDWHAFLDEETNDWRISLDAGRRRFGELPKSARLLIIQAILRGTQIDTGNTAAIPTMADYDAVRPQWAPGSTGLTKTFGCTWREILDLAKAAA